MKTLFGYGKTTKAIAKSGGWCIFDDKFTHASKDEFGNDLLPVSEFDAQKSELEVPSPGFPRTHELVQNSKNLISEYDYFLRNTPKNCIWISGTNGKTTTTQMTQHLLASFGSQMGGNVGTPLAELDPQAQIWILETSSFTLHYTKFATPLVYLLLPITPDHISWHGTSEEYVSAKLKPLKMMKKGSIAIVPKCFENTASYARVVGYKNEQDLARIFGFELGEVAFKEPFLLDAALALCAAKILTNHADVGLLNTFRIDSHKLEEFFDTNGRLWVDDTKATNIDAAICALKRYRDKFVRVIVGGDDKGVSLAPLFEAMRELNLACKVYAIGSNFKRVAELSAHFGVACEPCEFLEFAVNAMKKELKVGEVGLLSPACASLDQFSSYAERGEKFKAFVLKA